MLALHPSEVRTLIEDGELDATLVRGRWLISVASIERAVAARIDPHADQAPAPPEAGVRKLEARVAALEKRLDALEDPGAPDPGQTGLRSALQPLFRTTE
jgi:hypothetical protein